MGQSDSRVMNDSNETTADRTGMHVAAEPGGNPKVQGLRREHTLMNELYPTLILSLNLPTDLITF